MMEIFKNQTVIRVNWNNDSGEYNTIIFVDDVYYNKVLSAIGYAKNIWENYSDSDEYCDDIFQQLENAFNDFGVINWVMMPIDEFL